MTYNWQHPDWTDFRYDLAGLQPLLQQYVAKEGRLAGMLSALTDEQQQQSVIDLMVVEAIKSFAIEGEYLSREEVLSSVRNKLGLNRTPERIKDKRAEGVTRLMIAVRDHFAAPLDQEMLFHWHELMMEPYLNITKGAYRSGAEPMQIISGAIGREVVHFEAPPAAAVPGLMEGFFSWFNATAPRQDRAIWHAPVRAALAHLYFETIHPFEDGNGRIGRAISEKALSQSAGQPILFSLSSAIEASRNDYYEALQQAQRSREVTPWITYFLQTLLAAQRDAEDRIRFTIRKTQFFDRYRAQLNARQEKVLAKMFAAGPGGFQGGMSAKKYASITRCSKATATRDLTRLVELGALVRSGEGRSVRYDLMLP
jgi:Fic family protein